ncbi:MAG: hypothetical protein BMS9Abin02_1171 [Anaerolineae bacterium]|nr:MAG: hypothetical protein BMS9Abin02_1171 [Anaerolineae bacterium]
MTSWEAGDEPANGEQTIWERRFLIDLIIVGLIGLVIQGFWAWQVREPTYLDAYYYTTNGQRLADGYGFTERIIWQYFDNPEGIPTPSHTYWMPFTSMLAAAGYTIQDSFRGAQIPFWLLSGLLPLLSFGIATLLGGERWQAWTAALFTAAGGYYAAFMVQPSTFAPFAWAGASCLLFIGLTISVPKRSNHQDDRIIKGNLVKQRLYLLLTGIAAGFAHLTRADGLLFLIIGIAFWILYAAKGSRGPAKSTKDPNQHGEEVNTYPVNGRLFWSGLLILLAGYILVMGFWLTRNWLVTGGPLPQGGTQSLFLTTYDDIFAFNRPLDFRSYIDWGMINILKSKLQGISIGVQTYVAVLGFIFLVPFVIAGLVNSLKNPTRNRFIWPVLAYVSVLFLIMTLLFTFPGMRGSLFHSSIAAWPWSTVLATFGIGISIDWVAARLSHWQPQKAKRRFSIMFVVLAFIVGFVISWPRTQSSEDGDLLSEIGKSLPKDAVIFAGNAPAINYYTGLAALSVPNEPVNRMMEAADKFGGTYLILDENHPKPLVDLYHGNRDYPDIQLIDRYDNIKIYRLLVPGS